MAAEIAEDGGDNERETEAESGRFSRERAAVEKRDTERMGPTTLAVLDCGTGAALGG